ncbi:MAG: signal recognition particle-docking protein FtsY, partial [Nitrososphaeraceae archaeon]
NKKGPFVVVFLGINGTGKTTTVAKVANLLHQNGLSVVLAASDTHRAGAIEQLGEHARRLSLKMIHQRYGADPSAVARDAVEYGKKHRVDAILIDTAGRMQTAKNLMDEISKIVQVVKPDMKIFIGDSLAGNDAIYQAKEFFAYTKFDASILTKTDADAKGGAIISITYLTSKPIIYLGVGQNYDDIIPFDLDTFVESLFGSQISEEITKKYSSNIINESKNNEKLPDIQSKSISNNEPIHNIEELYQNTPSSSNLDPIISNNINNHDIAISKVELKEEEKKVDDLRNNNIINLENESQFGKSEKIAENDDEKKKGFFSSLFGKRKSLVNSDKVSSTTADQKSKQNNQGKPNSDKHQYNTINKNEISEKNKNKDKNEVKYLSDDDLDELLKE